MAFVYSQLTPISLISGGSPAPIYTNPASKTAYVRTIIIHNTNTTAETVTLYNVPDNGGAVGTATTSHQFYKQDIAADSTVILEFAVPGIMLTDTNDTLQANTTTANKVTIQITGGTE